jgi:AcrR family transcriptional regulator
VKPRTREPDVGKSEDSDSERRLLDCALTLFSTKGYAATGVRELIDLAGVTQPVLYYYFANKEDLFRQLVLRLHDSAHAELERVVRGADGCEARLRAIIQGSFAFCRGDPRIPRLMFQTAYGPPIEGVGEFVADLGRRRFESIREVMEDGLRHGELRCGDASALALAFCGLMDHHLNVLSRLPHPEQHLSPSLADSLVDLFLHGAGRVPGGSTLME